MKALQKIGLPVLLAVVAPSAAHAQPPAPDAATVALFHFDGDLADASVQSNPASLIGAPAPAFEPGKFGQALKLDGKTAVALPASAALHIGEQSWTLEGWIKPDKTQPMHAVIAGGGWGGGRQYGLRISYGKQLVAYFNASQDYSAYVGSGDVSATLFDGNWHAVAAVLDRARNGEVRLYLDGKEIKAEKPVLCPPISFETGKMAAIIGGTAPWDKSGYLNGAVDEIRFSNIVRPEYTATGPLPLLPPRPAKFVADPALSARPVTLTPDSTAIALGSLSEDGTAQAAGILQERLRKVYGVPTGFDLVSETAAAKLPGDKFVIALGRTRWVDADELSGLGRDGFLLRCKNNVLVIAGGSTRGDLAGAVRFLDLCAGTRFYMPGELWTSKPATKEITLGAIDRVEKPFVRSAFFSGLGTLPEEAAWSVRNITARRIGGVHQHNMSTVFDPKIWAEKAPEIYPILGGKRYIPTSPTDQNWNPDFTNPKTLDVAEEVALKFFRENPDQEYLAFSVQDSHRYAESPRMTAVTAEMKARYPDQPEEALMARAHSQIYWEFMNALAARLEKKAPGKMLVGLAYATTRYPPATKLHSNIVPFTNLHISEWEADRVATGTGLTNGEPSLDSWLKVAANYGNHDWYQGNGFLVPRHYNPYFQQFLRMLQKAGLQGAFMHIESYPNWGLDGPKYWVLNRLFWDPQQDSKALYKQFCDDMFGAGSPQVQEYFALCEKLWASWDNQVGPERKLNKWSNQFVTTEADRKDLARCRELLDSAAKAAATGEEKQRVELFSKSFGLSERIIALAAAPTYKAAQVEELKVYYAEKILPDPMTLNAAFRVPNALDPVIKAVTLGKKLED